MNWIGTDTKYLIIGAGPTGLACAKAFLDLDIPFYSVEASDGVGGLWDINNPNSTMYQSAHLISSRTLTEFAHFPMQNTKAFYPKHTEVLQYLNDYAEKSNIKTKIKFNTKVEWVEKQEDKWNVRLSDSTEYVFKGVVICSGILSEPRMPAYNGAFSGEQIHSAQYKTAEIFADKRVLIVGGGNSGCDIAVDAVHRAKSVDWSLRRGYFFMPKFVLGVPLDTLGKKWMPTWLKHQISKLIAKVFIGKVSNFGMQSPDHKLFEVHPILNSLVIHYLGHGDIQMQKDIVKLDGNQVEFDNGEKGDYDLIVYCTGYKIHYPFIDKKELNWESIAPNMYLNIFPPNCSNLFVLGMVEAAGLGWQGKYEQALLVANYLKSKESNGKIILEFEKAIRENNLDLNGSYNYKKLDRMAYYVHKDTYKKELNKWIKRFEKSMGK